MSVVIEGLRVMESALLVKRGQLACRATWREQGVWCTSRVNVVPYGATKLYPSILHSNRA